MFLLCAINIHSRTQSSLSVSLPHLCLSAYYACVHTQVAAGRRQRAASAGRQQLSRLRAVPRDGRRLQAGDRRQRALGALRVRAVAPRLEAQPQ